MTTGALRILRLALPLALLAALLPLRSRAESDEDGESNLRLVRNGWAVDTLDLEGTGRPGVRHLFAQGRVRLPASLAWYAIADENDTDWPGVDESIVEEEIGDTTIARYKIGVPLYADRRYRLRMVTDDRRMRVRFDLVPGYGNVRVIHGYWNVTAVSDSLSQLNYVLDTDPGVKWIPGFIVNWATKKEIPGLFKSVYEIGTRKLRNEARGVVGGGHLAEDPAPAQR